MADNEILLIEDNADSVRLALDLLANYRLANNIKVAYDGAQALEMLDTDLPALILLDLTLPKVSSLDVLAGIRSHKRSHEIPVIVVAQSQEDCDTVESCDLGVSGYILKPFDFEKFLRAVQATGFYWLLLQKMPGI